MLGDFRSTQFHSDWPRRPAPSIWGLPIDCEVHAAARTAWNRPRDLADGKISYPDHFSRSARSGIDGGFPYRAMSVIVLRQGGDGLLDLALAIHFAHRLAVARQIMASQPGWTNRYRSTSCAAASLVDGIPDPAIRSASSLSSTAISARAADETGEMDFRRLRQESSGGRRHQPRW